ncbi:MAG TPA: hypothetical protein QF730_09200 [Planctomycetota bacterium]|nr:hypothetical protein [Planctomycetota bacterium]
MTIDKRLTATLLPIAALLTVSCEGIIRESSSSGGSSASMDLLEVSNGFGQLVPHTIVKLVGGQPSQQIISIRSHQDLLDNLTVENRVLPVAQWVSGPLLPSNAPGNHFVFARFDQPLDIGSVLDPSPAAQANSGFTGAITVTALDPFSGESTALTGRVLLNGETYSGTPQSDPPQLALQTWVTLDGTGKPVAEDVEGATPGVGFPGTEGNFEGSTLLVSPNTLVFVVDTDDDLSTHETFPSGSQIRINISTAVRAVNGKYLVASALGCATVGEDTLTPEVMRTPPPSNNPVITPGSGATEVDPTTMVRVEFTEPIQPLTLSTIEDGTPPGTSSSILLQFGPDASRVNVPYGIQPASIYDFSTWDLVPAFNFPGTGPDFLTCGTFSTVDVIVNSSMFEDLAWIVDPDTGSISGNANTLSPQTWFETGVGPGVVNAPVAPDTITVARFGANPGLSVIDLNGFGAGTGDPTYDPSYQVFTEGWSNYPNNPNLKLQGSALIPPLQPGNCTINGGSAGVFTMTLDSNLSNLVLGSPLVSSVGDMMIGHALDTTFNNGPAPFGCQSTGGNLCAFDGKKLIQAVMNGNTLTPVQPGQFGGSLAGYENLISWAPHPNPPPLIFPPPCVSPFLNGQEPTAIDTVANGVTNLLGPGNPFGNPAMGQPPSGLLTSEQNAHFLGPSPQALQISACFDYMIRQQVGQFLYMLDRSRNEVVVINSNRMTVVDRIDLDDPTALAMGPNLDFLAISSQASNLVSFLDIDPSSASFHKIVKAVVVGTRPRGIAWDPGNEDILVCNEGDSTVSVISAHSLDVRKVVSSQLSQPFDVVITPRQANFGFFRNVYFGWIINRTGHIAIFESGPNTVNGWGYDDVIGIASFDFRNPKTLQPDHINLDGGVWVLHEGPIDMVTEEPGDYGEGAVTNLAIQSGIAGQLPLNLTSLTIPQYRDMYIGISKSIGEEVISGIPVDMAFDSMRNLAGTPNYFTTWSAGQPLPANGKNLVRPVPGGAINTNEPTYMFLAVPTSTNQGGVVDVLNIAATGLGRADTNAYQEGIQSVPAADCNVLVDYFRQ